MMMQYVTGEAATVFDAIRIPVMTVNGELWPVNVEANRRQMAAYDAVILKGAEQSLMMDRPEEFNRALALRPDHAREGTNGVIRIIFKLGLTMLFSFYRRH
jgi:hypothetical protein